jgi:hypothetical protein
MIYRIYKYCTEKDFSLIKRRLEILKEKIAYNYKHILKSQNRADESDFLDLNFRTDDPPFQGNIYIQFVDKPNLTSFNIMVIKTFDKGQFRYSKRKEVYKQTELQSIEENYDNMIGETLLVYHSWSESDLLHSDKDPKFF